MFTNIGKMLILLGVVMVVTGVVFILVGKIPFVGKLPGDIHVQKKNFEFHFPVVTCIVTSILLSFLVSVFFLWFKK
jgi:hypothetical protein